MERRLGRGLGSLLGSQAVEGQPQPEEPQAPAGGGTRTLPIQKVRPNPNQPRKVFDSAALEELRDSIGVLGTPCPSCEALRTRNRQNVQL